MRSPMLNDSERARRRRRASRSGSTPANDTATPAHCRRPMRSPSGMRQQQDEDRRGREEEHAAGGGGVVQAEPLQAEVHAAAGEARGRRGSPSPAWRVHAVCFARPRKTNGSRIGSTISSRPDGGDARRDVVAHRARDDPVARPQQRASRHRTSQAAAAHGSRMITLRRCRMLECGGATRSTTSGSKATAAQADAGFPARRSRLDPPVARLPGKVCARPAAARWSTTATATASPMCCRSRKPRRAFHARRGPAGPCPSCLQEAEDRKSDPRRPFRRRLDRADPRRRRAPGARRGGDGAARVHRAGLPRRRSRRRKTLSRTRDLPERLGRYHRDARKTFYGWADVWLDPDFTSWDIREDYLPQGRCPVLAIQGRRRRVRHHGAARRDRGAGAGPCELLKLEDCGHAPFRDQPEKRICCRSKAFVEKPLNERRAPSSAWSRWRTA